MATGDEDGGRDSDARPVLATDGAKPTQPDRPIDLSPPPIDSGVGGTPARLDAAMPDRNGSGGTGGSVGGTGGGTAGTSGGGMGGADAGVTPAPDAAPPAAIVDQLLAITPATCAMKLSKDYDLDTSKTDPDTVAMNKAAICGLKGAAYWVADMDIDCDGEPEEGKCTGADEDTFTHNEDGDPLSPADTPYAVIPEDAALPGLKAGTIVVVINNLTKKMTYAIYGDTRAGEIGGASYACAEALGIDPKPANGGQKGKTVTYIAFLGDGTVPPQRENRELMRVLGEMLVTKLLAANAP